MPLFSLQLSYATKYMKTLGQISQDFKKNRNVTGKHHSTFLTWKYDTFSFFGIKKVERKVESFLIIPFDDIPALSNMKHKS